MQIFQNDLSFGNNFDIFSGFGVEEARKSLSFHKSVPGYRESDLASLGYLAKKLNVGAVYVKDESSRFGLNSFKGLGGSRCVAEIMAEKMGLDTEHLGFSEISAKAKEVLAGSLVFCTATDGNHGLGIAWSAKAMGQKCIIFLPKGSTAERVERIRNLGVEVHVSNDNYDVTVEAARALAKENNWIFVQDTDDEHSSETVARLMKGYLTLAIEIAEKLGKVPPTHIFLQAGVGSFAGSMAAFFSSFYKANPPRIIVVEAENAACLMKTAKKNDNRIHSVEGDLKTMMAGLSCGTPCRLGWKILHQCAGTYISISDASAAEGMRRLAKPLPGDPMVVSGESGAAGFAAFLELMTDPALEDARKKLQLGPASRVLCISTEGDTDKANYRRVIEGTIQF